MKDTRKYSQHHADILNLEKNALETVPIEDLLGEEFELDLDLLAVRDREVMDLMRNRGIADRRAERWNALTTGNAAADKNMYAAQRLLEVSKGEKALQFPNRASALTFMR